MAWAFPAPSDKRLTSPDAMFAARSFPSSSPTITDSRPGVMDATSAVLDVERFTFFTSRDWICRTTSDLLDRSTMTSDPFEMTGERSAPSAMPLGRAKSWVGVAIVTSRRNFSFRPLASERSRSTALGPFIRINVEFREQSIYVLQRLPRLVFGVHGFALRALDHSSRAVERAVPRRSFGRHGP